MSSQWKCLFITYQIETRTSGELLQKFWESLRRTGSGSPNDWGHGSSKVSFAERGQFLVTFSIEILLPSDIS